MGFLNETIPAHPNGKANIMTPSIEEAEPCVRLFEVTLTR